MQCRRDAFDGVLRAKTECSDHAYRTIGNLSQPGASQ
jgi:hypothetical protein